MNRAELEALNRDALIARAEKAGVSRARILTRPELVDELLLRSATDDASRRRARGFFGLARDLVARVVERGLHLPDAAQRIRTLDLPIASHASAPAALPTVTLAEIYAAQGHRDRAVETLESVLQREPDHGAARALLAQLRDASFPVPQPRLPPEPEEPLVVASSSADLDAPDPVDATPREPFGMLDDAPLPARYDVDECVAIPVDPTTLYVYWEARDATLAKLRGARDGGRLVLRVLVVVPTWDGPSTSVRDFEVGGETGDYFVRDLPKGCVARAAIGWRDGAGTFESIAHSAALETPPGRPSAFVAEDLVRWTPEGARPVAPGDPDAAGIARALSHVRHAELRALRPGIGGFGGSSEIWAIPLAKQNGARLAG